MLLVDTVKGEVVDDEKLKEFYASREPYGEWIDRNLVELARLKIPNVKVESYTGDQLTRLQKVFGYKYEDVNTMILSMARAGAEPSGAMGTDTPLAVLSNQHPPLFNYFKQRFAQVTNPPIDAIREKWSLPPACILAHTATFWRTNPRTARCSRCTTPS